MENDDQSSNFGTSKQLYFKNRLKNHRVWVLDHSCPFYLCRIGNRSLMEDEKHSKTKYLIVDTGDDLTASLSADIQHSP